MKITVLYDSQFGNTQKVAAAIADTVKAGGDVALVGVKEATVEQITKTDFLIVGSPTQGGRATLALQSLLKSIPANGLKDVEVAAFDTRFSINDHGAGLKLVMKLCGFAAGRILQVLTTLGATTKAPAEGFIVNDKEGPIKEGELDRARQWAKLLINEG